METLAEAGRRYLGDRINIANLPQKGDEPEMRTAWLIVEGPVEYEPSKEPGFEFPIGIIAVFPAGRFRSVVWTRPRWADGVQENYEMLLWVRPRIARRESASRSSGATRSPS